MKAEHRRRKFWEAIADDRYRKLVAIGLAVLLWWFIDRRITDSWTLPMPLVAGDVEELQRTDRISNQLAVLLPDGGRVVGKRFLDGDREIQDVRVTFSGPRYRIDALREQVRVQLEDTARLDAVDLRQPAFVILSAAGESTVPHGDVSNSNRVCQFLRQFSLATQYDQVEWKR